MTGSTPPWWRRYQTWPAVSSPLRPPCVSWAVGSYHRFLSDAAGGQRPSKATHASDAEQHVQQSCCRAICARTGGSVAARRWLLRLHVSAPSRTAVIQLVQTPASSAHVGAALARRRDVALCEGLRRRRAGSANRESCTNRSNKDQEEEKALHRGHAGLSTEARLRGGPVSVPECGSPLLLGRASVPSTLFQPAVPNGRP